MIEAEDEGVAYLVKEGLQKLKEELNLHKIDELIKEEEEIKSMLKHEIITRFYFRKGRIESTLTEDKIVMKAQELLVSKDLYEDYLKGNINEIKEN
jgi:carboxyl-terminal processing protease